MRYLIDPPDGCLQRPVGTVRPELVYCLGFDGASDDWCHMFQCDSDPSLLSRFAAERLAVVPLSACSPGYPTTEVATGRRAAVITTGDLCWLGPTRVEVEAAYHFGLASDMSFRLQLRQSADKWVVDICEITGVS